VKTLSEDAFRKHYVNAGRRCWLLKTEQRLLSASVMTWLERTPPSVRKNHTCRDREHWYAFKLPPTPAILYSSGFRRPSPRFLVNDVGARAVGSVHGVFNAPAPSLLAAKLRRVDFASSSLRYGGDLLKIEVSQMNRLLDTYAQKKRTP
jgi:hypothetical protein